MDHQDPTLVNTRELQFDRQNPRLAGMDISVGSTDEDIIRILWDAMDVRELVMSIQASGFFSHEFLIVEEDTQVVLEGNRRLAAVRLLLEPAFLEERANQIPRLPTSALEALETVPVIYKTREEAWRYLGFKHVNGPAKWSSYAKSCYIASVHRDHGVSLEDIAHQIGDTHKTVQRLFQGLMVKEQAVEAGSFDLDDRWYNHFSFSHLYTGIRYQGISDFLNLDSESEENTRPVPKENMSKLGELFVWLYGSKREKKPPVIRSQNPDLRHLDRVLSHPEAREALRAGQTLDLALKASRPPTSAFRESLMSSKRLLQDARALSTTGYDGTVELFTIAEEVADLAYDLYQEMARKRQPGPRRRVRGLD